jgi:hypothetical protein
MLSPQTSNTLPKTMLASPAEYSAQDSDFQCGLVRKASYGPEEAVLPRESYRLVKTNIMSDATGAETRDGN